MKISQEEHITKDGIIKRNPVSNGASITLTLEDAVTIRNALEKELNDVHVSMLSSYRRYVMNLRDRVNNVANRLSNYNYDWRLEK